MSGRKFSPPSSTALIVLVVACLKISASAAAADQHQPVNVTSSKTLQNRLHFDELPLQSSDSDPNRHSTAPLVTNENFFTKQQMELAHEMIQGRERAQAGAQVDMAEYSYRVLLVRLLSLGYADLYVHRYENYKELRDFAGPQADQEKCLRQLGQLVARADQPSERDINLYQLMDTYGRAPAGVLDGDTTWLGSYDACLRMQIAPSDDDDDHGQQPTGTRYCLASLRQRNWPEHEERKTLEQVTVFKSAVCLPRACDSVSYKNKYNLVQRLVEFNARRADLNSSFVSNIYCLPDEQSQARLWWSSRATLLVVSCVAGWLTLLVYATYRDEFALVAPPDGMCASTKFYRSLSIAHNLRSLFSTTDKISQSTGANSPKKMIVNLDMIEGIKVLAACYIITGHVMMISTGIIRNSREMSVSNSVAYVMSNLMPAFAVNIFFSITGILTAYLMFKQDQTRSFVRQPLKWVAFILYRYLRIMPMYALVVLYCKHVARYVGSGPLWDYGTSSLGARRTCEQEPWAWTLLFGANFKSPMKHCIPSAWYLANDFQFFMVTPLLLAALHLNARLGKRLLWGGILAGYVAGFWNVLASEAHDIKPIAQFMPHGFMTYITFLYDNYTRPQYRIPAYLVGLLLGHKLYEYERRQVEFSDSETGASQEQVTPAGWPRWMTRYGPTIGVLAALVIALTPSVGSRFSHSDWSARLLVAFVMPTYHLIYALSVGLYILLATTGYGNGFVNGLLSLKFWKPLARLSLCVVLLNVEVIAYIIQSHKSMHSLTNQYHTCLNMLSITCTYLVAIMVCVLFESPVRALLNHLLAAAVHRASVKKKTT